MSTWKKIPILPMLDNLIPKTSICDGWMGKGPAEVTDGPTGEPPEGG